MINLKEIQKPQLAAVFAKKSTWDEFRGHVAVAHTAITRYYHSQKTDNTHMSCTNENNY